MMPIALTFLLSASIAFFLEMTSIFLSPFLIINTEKRNATAEFMLCEQQSLWKMVKGYCDYSVEHDILDKQIASCYNRKNKT